ncbi:MAG: RNA polymerase sigma factor [Sphingobium sp.]
MSRSTLSEADFLADAHYAGLLRYVRSRVKSPSLAADIVQESWLRALTAMRARDVGNGRNYLFRTARNLLIDHHRQERSRSTWMVSGELPEDVACDSPGVEREVIARQELDRIMALVVELPPKCQAVFVMRRFDGLEPRDIATRLNIRRGTVEKHLRLALGHLLAGLQRS